MTAERIANAVRRFREGHVQLMEGMGPRTPKLSGHEAVVDISAIYAQIRAMRSFEPYEQVCRPPWMDAVLCCDDPEHDAIYLVTLSALDVKDPVSRQALEAEERRIGSELGTNWDEQRWAMILSVMGVANVGASVRGVLGPLACWAVAVDEDGKPGTIRGRISPIVAVTPNGNETGLDPDDPEEVAGYNAALQELLCACLAAFTFLNCRNVTVAVPHRPRAQARRLDRIGVEVTEIHVYSMGRTVQGTRPLSSEGGVPAHAVRGNLARYGPKYDRGLLFGKHEGMFWRPMHARGNPVHGTREHEYVLEQG